MTIGNIEDTHNRAGADVGNSVNSGAGATYLAHLTDEQIVAAIDEQREQLIQRNIPGARTQRFESLGKALAESANADFIVEKHPLMVINSEDGLADEDAAINPVASHVATVRTDTMATVGIVGSDYGVVQTMDAFRALDILQERKDVEIVAVETLGGGARVRVTAMLGETTFPSQDGAPNTICHFGVFEATHDGSACTTSALYSLRIECFNGMTSRNVIGVHKLRHTSLVESRLEAYAQKVLTDLIGDAEAEVEIFRSMVNRAMNARQFSDFATEFLGGELEEEASKGKKTRRENEMKELEDYFSGGNQGAGPTAWGAYNSVTRWVESKREAMDDAAKNRAKYTSNLQGDGQRKIARALRMLTR